MVSESDEDDTDKDISNNEDDGSSHSCGAIVSTCVGGVIFRGKNLMWRGQEFSEDEEFINQPLTWGEILTDDETDPDHNIQDFSDESEISSTFSIGGPPPLTDSSAHSAASSYGSYHGEYLSRRIDEAIIDLSDSEDSLSGQS